MTDLRLLHGTDEPFPELRPLRAGPVSLFLDGIDLRYLRIGGTELVRRVYTAVRDVDWDTVPGESPTSGWRSRTPGSGSSSTCATRGTRSTSRWHGTIAGDESGRIEFVFDGRADERLSPTTGSASASTTRGARRPARATARAHRTASARALSPT